LNPVVLSLPAHSHLFAEPGCFHDYIKPNIDCGAHLRSKKYTKLHNNYFPVRFDQEQEDKWKSMLNKIKATNKKTKAAKKKQKPRKRNETKKRKTRVS